MSRHNPVRTEQRGKRQVLIVDFFFIDSRGRRQRYRRDASVQTRAGAQAEARRLMERAAKTGSPIETRTVPTFASFVDSHYRPLFMARLRPGTAKRYEGILQQGVLEHFGRVRLDDVTKPAVLAFAATLTTRRRKKKLHDKTHGIDPRGPVNFVKSVLRAAVDVGVLEKMPDLPTYKQPRKLPAAPPAEHAAALVANAEGWLLVAVALQSDAGLRQQEVRALQARDVDFANKLIFVRRVFSENELWDLPKGDKERMVPMTDGLAAILRDAVQGKLPGAFIVTRADGEPLNRQEYLKALKRFERQHGLAEWASHPLRHGFLSDLARAGANIEAIRTIAGHANLATTQRYLHVTRDDLVATVAKLRREKR